MQTPNKTFSVYFIADAKTAQRFGVNLNEVVKKACRAGVSIVQYRNKNASDKEFLDTAYTLRKITDEFGVPLILNDRAHLVKQVNADGVHLGQDDLPCKEARKLVGENAIIGITTKSAKEAQLAEIEGATYVAASNIFPTTTKKGLPPPAGIERIREIKRAVKIPVVAVAGITDAEKAKQAILAGADGVAVVRAIMLATDVESAVKELLQAVELGLKLRILT